MRSRTPCKNLPDVHGAYVVSNDSTLLGERFYLLLVRERDPDLLKADIDTLIDIDRHVGLPRLNLYCDFLATSKSTRNMNPRWRQPDSGLGGYKRF